MLSDQADNSHQARRTGPHQTGDTTMTTIDNNQDIIDSRDIIARIEDLQSDRQTLLDAIEEAQEILDDLDDDASDDTKTDAVDAVADTKAELFAWDADNSEELKSLTDLAEEASNSPDWQYGEALIRRSYFVDYAQELAEECGMVPNNLQWPMTCLDWDQAARELEMDYINVDFDGVEYLIRA